MTDIGPKRPTVERTVFSTPRSGEFLELRALQAQTGQPASEFGGVVVKELLDNALDAAEKGDEAPFVEIVTRTDGEITFVTVTNNGAGIAPDTVTGLCDFSALVSDKARYRGPSRGQQGNAMKTLLGIPFALGVAEPVVIEAAGVRHELTVTERLGEVEVIHETTASDRTVGTSVTVPLPARLDIDGQWWAYRAALVNPHVAITAIDRAYSGGDDDVVSYKPAAQTRFSKWTSSMPSSPHWYDLAAFTELVHSHIREIERIGKDKPLGGFITEFDGLSGSAKQQKIRRAAAGVTHLSGLEERDDLIAALHAAMLEHAKLTPPGRLGPVGRDHLKRLLDRACGVERDWYKAVNLTVDGVPWIVEVAVADTNEPGETWFACNHAPSFGDPLDTALLETGDVRLGRGVVPHICGRGYG